SASFGRRGAWFTVGPRGTRATIGIPGSGLSYTTSSPWRRPPHARPQAPVAAPTDIASIEEPAPSPVAPAVTEPAPEAATPAHAVAPLATPDEGVEHDEVNLAPIVLSLVGAIAL